MSASVVVALFTRRNSDVEAVLLGWQRAGREGRVDTWRILDAVEVEHDSAGLVETVAGQRRVEEAAGLIRGGGARGVAEDEEELLFGRIFDDRLKPQSLAVERELGDAGRSLVADLSEDVGDGQGMRRVRRNPLCRDDKAWIGRIPIQTVKVSSCGSLRIFDAEIEAVAALDHDHQEAVVTKLRRMVLIEGEFGRSGGLAVESNASRKASGGRYKGD